MFGINQSKNQSSNAATTNTTDSNNVSETGSRNVDSSKNTQGGNINEYSQADQISSGGGAVSVGEQGIGAHLVDALTGLLRPGATSVASDHTYTAGEQGTASVGNVKYSTIIIAVAVVATLGVVAYVAMREK